MPKCMASQVTVSPNFMTPEVTPATGRSCVCATERRCKSTLSERSKQRSIGALMDVSNRIKAMLYSHIEHLSLSRCVVSHYRDSLPYYTRTLPRVPLDDGIHPVFA